MKKDKIDEILELKYECKKLEQKQEILADKYKILKKDMDEEMERLVHFSEKYSTDYSEVYDSMKNISEAYDDIYSKENKKIEYEISDLLYEIKKRSN